MKVQGVPMPTAAMCNTHVGQARDGLNDKVRLMAAPVSELEALVGGGAHGAIWSEGATMDNILEVYDNTLAKVSVEQITKVSAKAQTAVSAYTYFTEVCGSHMTLPTDDAATGLLRRHKNTLIRLTVTQFERLLCQALVRKSKPEKLKGRLETLTASLTGQVNQDWSTIVAPQLVGLLRQGMGLDAAAAEAPPATLALTS